MKSKFNKHILRVRYTASEKFNDFPEVIELNHQKMDPGHKGPC
jgi:hypothetical protein